MSHCYFCQQQVAANDKKCAHCGKDFVYLMQRAATAETRSPLFLNNEGAQNRAASTASAALNEKLKREFEIVPCVHCRKFQPEMARRVRFGQHLWLAMLGLAIVVLSGALILVTQWPDPERDTSPPAPLGKLLIYPGIGLVMIAVYVAMWLRFDPNEMGDEQKARFTGSPSIDREAFESRMAEASQSGRERVDLLTLFQTHTS